MKWKNAHQTFFLFSSYLHQRKSYRSYRSYTLLLPVFLPEPLSPSTFATHTTDPIPFALNHKAFCSLFLIHSYGTTSENKTILNLFRLSIPTGTIKRVCPIGKSMGRSPFQFLQVRLKAISLQMGALWLRKKKVIFYQRDSPFNGHEHQQYFRNMCNYLATLSYTQHKYQPFEIAGHHSLHTLHNFT